MILTRHGMTRYAYILSPYILYKIESVEADSQRCVTSKHLTTQSNSNDSKQNIVTSSLSMKSEKLACGKMNKTNAQRKQKTYPTEKRYID